MTDLHTHILPGIDDGARSVEESLAMLRMERGQGVDTVVLTPHFYRDRENPKRFLRRRKESAAALAQASETPKVALAPSFDLSLVPSSSIMTLSIEA